MAIDIFSDENEAFAIAIWTEAIKHPGTEWPKVWTRVKKEDRDNFRFIAALALEAYKAMHTPAYTLN